MDQNIIPITDASFEIDIIKSDQTVLLDFWAPWCSPCKIILPMLEEAAIKFNDKLKICKINVDEQNETAIRYSVRGIPTLILFKNGEVLATKVGALSQNDLINFIVTHV